VSPQEKKLLREHGWGEIVFEKTPYGNEVSCYNAKTRQRRLTVTDAGKREAVLSLGLDILRDIRKAVSA
jgi:hypothetical protein